MVRTNKPAPGNNGFLGNTVTSMKIKVINEDTNRWETIGECVDTPRTIEEELKKKVYKGKSIWLFSSFGKTYHGLVK